MTREPTDDRKRRRSPAGWTSIVAVGLLTTYFALYQYGCDTFFQSHHSHPGLNYRLFRDPLRPKYFIPAAWLEARLTGRTVFLTDTYGPDIVIF